MRGAALLQSPEAAERFLADLKSGAIPRVPGTTVFLTRSTQKVSRLIMEHARFVGVLPAHTIALSIVFENTPRVVGPKCSAVDNLGEGLWHVVARFGFFEIPDLRLALRHAYGLDAAIDIDQALFVGTRDLVVCKTVGGRRSWMAHGAVCVPLSQRREGRRPVQSRAWKTWWKSLARSRYERRQVRFWRLTVQPVEPFAA